MPKVGAHVSAAQSLSKNFERAEGLGAECTQIFISPPQQWAKTNHSDEEIKDYRRKTETSNIHPNFIHSIYLINLASANPENLQKSIDWLIYSQKMAEKLGIEGTIFHIGSAKKLGKEPAIKQVVQSIKEILKNSDQVNLILENSAGAGELIGDKFDELGEIVKAVNNPRVKICLDTQHAFASGYDLRAKEGVDRTLTEFDQKVGLQNLAVIHANDSKTELNSHRDRHENIGQGLIGLEGFKNLVNHPALTEIPFILEVPGIVGSGPDKNNVLLLKSLMN
jgi:deoxyribonuclease IV